MSDDLGFQQEIKAIHEEAGQDPKRAITLALDYLASIAASLERLSFPEQVVTFGPEVVRIEIDPPEPGHVRLADLHVDGCEFTSDEGWTCQPGCPTRGEAADA